MATDPASVNYQGTAYPVPTDPNYYLSQTGLASLQPQAFNANTLASMMSPQGMSNTPINNLATNPFLQLFMQSNEQATKLPRKQTGGADQGMPAMA